MLHYDRIRVERLLDCRGVSASAYPSRFYQDFQVRFQVFEFYLHQ
jgi:hypothetical protein